jgi:hypothetical protein
MVVNLESAVGRREDGCKGGCDGGEIPCAFCGANCWAVSSGFARRMSPVDLEIGTGTSNLVRLCCRISTACVSRLENKN